MFATAVLVGFFAWLLRREVDRLDRKATALLDCLAGGDQPASDTSLIVLANFTALKIEASQKEGQYFIAMAATIVLLAMSDWSWLWGVLPQ